MYYKTTRALKYDYVHQYLINSNIMESGTIKTPKVVTLSFVKIWFELFLIRFTITEMKNLFLKLDRLN